MFYALAALLGGCIGSFLNVVIFRTQNQLSVWNGRSKCRSCEVTLGWKDLLPLLSYVHLKGQCRHCKQVIDWQYPAVEFATGILFLIAFAATSFDGVLLIRNWIFIAFLVSIFVYDLRYLFILDRFTIPGMIVAILANLWIGLIDPWSYLLGALVLGGFFLVQYVLSKGTWIGGGDIRMGVLMGLMLGLQQGLVALFLSYVIGALVAIGLLLAGKVTRKTALPFGTFLVLGTLICLFVGQELLGWYLQLFLT